MTKRKKNWIENELKTPEYKLIFYLPVIPGYSQRVSDFLRTVKVNIFVLLMNPGDILLIRI